MRVLFTTNPGSGLWHPLVPYAEALQGRGHEVAFATALAACAAISGLGFRCFPVGEDETLEGAQRRRIRMMALGEPEGAAWAWEHLFAGAWGAGRLDDLLTIAAEWSPDLVVREDTEFAGCIAAERAGVPHAAVQVTAWRPWLHHRIVQSLNRLRESAGLVADPDLTMLHRYLMLSPVPAGYEDSGAPWPPTAHAVRHVAFDRSGAERLPAWASELSDRPVVYATMGTAFNRVAGILDAIVAGLRDEPITLIVTVGRDQDPAGFGPRPSHVHIVHYIPQSLLFPYCDLVVIHGGTGTVRTALDFGLPMVIVPVSADQPDNARRCEQLGVAQVIAPTGRSPEAFRDAVRTVLREPAYRRNAARLRDEMEKLPGPNQVIDWFERLASDQRPQISALPVPPPAGPGRNMVDS